jgi:Na+-transporting NADH:ubiquinone oxidoreductase subunit NqrD
MSDPVAEVVVVTMVAEVVAQIALSQAPLVVVVVAVEVVSTLMDLRAQLVKTTLWDLSKSSTLWRSLTIAVTILVSARVTSMAMGGSP